MLSNGLVINALRKFIRHTIFENFQKRKKTTIFFDCNNTITLPLQVQNVKIVKIQNIQSTLVTFDYVNVAILNN